MTVTLQAILRMQAFRRSAREMKRLLIRVARMNISGLLIFDSNVSILLQLGGAGG
jgi:hypothetical protein